MMKNKRSILAFEKLKTLADASAGHSNRILYVILHFSYALQTCELNNNLEIVLIDMPFQVLFISEYNERNLSVA